MIRINRAGLFYIAVTILIGFSAVNTGNNLVYIVTSALLSYMLVSGIFGLRNIRSVDVSLRLPDKAYAGRDFPVKVNVKNLKRSAPVFLIRVSIMDAEVLFPFIKANDQEEQSVMLRFERRGRGVISGVLVSSPFPFNFFRRYRQIKAQWDIIVYPRPIHCRILNPRDDKSRSRGEESSTSSGHDGDIVSIRSYVAGDPMKYINWKATAKTGALKTKELSSTSFQYMIIDWSTWDKSDLEFALSCMTYLVLKVVRSKSPVVLALDGERLQPGIAPSHKTRALKKLALYGEA